MDPPPNCQSVSQSGDAQQCSYEFSCDAQTHFTNCSLETATRWACECGTFSGPSKHYEIEGVESLEACGLIASACMTEMPAVGPVTCEQRERTADASTCGARDTCGTALDLGPNITARAVDEYRSSCSPGQSVLFPQGGYSCTCEGGALDRREWAVGGPALEDVCGPMVEFCVKEMSPDRSGTEKCADESLASSSASDCGLLQYCGWPVDLGDGVTLMTISERDTTCQQQNGVWQCGCVYNGESLYFDANVTAQSPDICRTIAPMCQPDATFERVGTPTCTPSYPTSDAASCSVELDCTQPATLNGIKITGYGKLLLDCTRDSSGTSWHCSCASSASTTTFDLASASDPSQVCVDAASQCPNDAVSGMPGPL
jgi:hypothetical protein